MKFERKNKQDNTIDKGYQGILYPTGEQEVLIAKTLGCCRYVYNRFLSERIEAFEKKKRTLSYVEQCKELPLLKADPATLWLKEADATALQYSVRTLQDAYDSFFRAIREGRKTGHPKFKSKREHRQSYRSVNNLNTIRLTDERHLRLPKLGEVKCRFGRKPQGRILHATVTREADGRYTVSLMCEEQEPEEAPKTGKAVGVDLGIRTLAVTSDGTQYDNPKTYANNRKRLARAQRQLSRKKKGSGNWEKQRRKVARLHRKIRNQRLDACHKMTHELVQKYDVICIEDLDLVQMEKSRFAKEVSDAALGEIRRQLTYKCQWAGKRLVTVDRWYPSSQTCSACGHVNRDVRDLKIRQWKCPKCGAWHDRDVNAAKNILREGLSMIA